MKPIVYYDLYIKAIVFEDPELNIFCNQLYTFLINNFDQETVENNLVLDREIALLLQGKDVLPFNNIIFTVTSKPIFKLLENSGKSLDVEELRVFPDRVEIRAFKTLFVFNFLMQEIEKTLYKGIVVRDFSEIK